MKYRASGIVDKNISVASLRITNVKFLLLNKMGRVKRIWYLSLMRAAKVQASLRIAQSRHNLRCSLIQEVSQEEPSDRKPDPWPL